MTKQDLIHKANVVYVRSGKKIIGGVNTGRDAIVVGVTNKVPMNQLRKEDRIPKKIHGRETDVIDKTEKIVAFRTSKHRPAPGGVSIGHPKVTAGTLGMVLTRSGDRFILSNNHVLANSNDASIGDQTWQPGRHDGGGPADTIGHLSRFVPIVFSGDESQCPIMSFFVRGVNFILRHSGHKSRLRTFVDVMNTVDCAVAKPLNDNDVSEEILEIGTPTGFAEAVTGEVVRKSGRTTELTENIVLATDGMVNVNYGEGKMATFADQVMQGAMSEGGDSGSVMVNKNNEVVELLFAGSSQVTIGNKISNVLEQLELGGINE